MNNDRLALQQRLIAAAVTTRKLLLEIYKMETDTQTPVIERRSRIQNIREKLAEVGQEVDIIKKEITILNTYRVN